MSGGFVPELAVGQPRVCRRGDRISIKYFPFRVPTFLERGKGRSSPPEWRVKTLACVRWCALLGELSKARGQANIRVSLNLL